MGKRPAQPTSGYTAQCGIHWWQVTNGSTRSLFAFFEGCGPQLKFRHNFNLQASLYPNVGFDEGVLE
jgi:hypothetical protein